ncbi:unnamed protein product [Vitrella brassicaformis CCMP3155]|uniref:N-acetyltransferase domain-containing protein n=2 Tax=Vitrella brassicaformis TaxID=1169539 RepID=A0A0G4H6V7_VITBC|nr:unnamed protein product [Vitrella brassicaformis CCMP3155]|mmetsp:Transcript_2505/g.5700  ORF Transcript_2505/g.5700 Transcript_2505/m.5700 type:complete len:200 (+) Transcript_2505:65-664(+)|eukprot:CEM39546.1 unnamed protein product [Vitrella brassicaformis CCMP3155]
MLSPMIRLFKSQKDLGDGTKVVCSSFEDESQLERIMELVARDLSEPYSIWTYRCFILQYPQFCIVAHIEDEIVGVVVCKVEDHKSKRLNEVLKRGYIGMVAVDKDHRKKGIGSMLVRGAVDKMQVEGIQEVVLEAETTNKAALALYAKQGFVKQKRLNRYYLSGKDAFRLKKRFDVPHHHPGIGGQGMWECPGDASHLK